uniref:Ubiquitin carboxyl-terminal hydrolase 7 n=1 Tax=Rhabditophanes sp. KR3021 TaxID=114890 RepID=A0AC35U801_9BILA
MDSGDLTILREKSVEGTHTENEDIVIDIDEMDQTADNIAEQVTPITLSDDSPRPTSNITIVDDLIEDDKYKPEAELELELHKFSEFTRQTVDHQRFSPTVYCRGLPWRILAMPRDGNPSKVVYDKTSGKKCLGFFLQCNGESDMIGWTCTAQAELRICSNINSDLDHNRSITHTFYPKENDWGYSQFMSNDQILDAEKGYYKNDTIKLKVHVFADAPHGTQWDSRRHAGYVGLKNQGATCYMNSILQTFFFTNKLRKAVYQIPLENGGGETSVPLAMQRVFFELQKSEKPVSTKKLTRSFGWESVDTFLQHDVQELCRVLLDNLEAKMKNTSVADVIPYLFRGSMKSFIRCKNVEYESSREEQFYDIQLNVKDKKNIMESFRDYVAIESLEGDNKYDAGIHGLQDAEKGMKFMKLPPVLHLQLMRFQYDGNMDTMVKVNDRFDFPEILDLNEFMDSSVPGSGEFTYHLHAVLVHSGDFHGGHYVAYINTNCGKVRRWCKFDDDVVSRASTRDALDGNFGGDASERLGRPYTNAYMLVYIKKDLINEVLCDVTDEDIPSELVGRLKQELVDEDKKKREKIEAHLHMDFTIVHMDFLKDYVGFDICDDSKINSFLSIKVEKKMTIYDFYTYLAKTINMPVDFFRVWQIRPNMLKDEGDGKLISYRPVNLLARINEDRHPNMNEVSHFGNETALFVEFKKDDRGILMPLKPYDSKTDLLFFIKTYDPRTHTVKLRTTIIFSLDSTIADYKHIMGDLLKCDPDDIRYHEEIAPDYLRTIGTDNTVQIKKVLHLCDGGILVIECATSLSTDRCIPYWHNDAYHSCGFHVIQVCDAIGRSLNKTADGAPFTFNMRGSLNWSFKTLAKKIGEMINYDDEKIYIYHSTLTTDKIPTFYVDKTSYDEIDIKNLYNLNNLECHDPRRDKLYKLFYTKLPIKVTDIQTRRIGRAMLLLDKQHQYDTIVYSLESDTIQELLEDFKDEFDMVEPSVNKLRAVLMGGSPNFRVYNVYPTETRMDQVLNKIANSAFLLRIEEIPEDQRVLDETREFLMPVSHYDKDPQKLWGVPFFVKVTNGEPFTAIKERLQKYLELNDKEMEKCRFTLINNQKIVKLIDMNGDNIVNINELASCNLGQNRSMPTLLGIDHPNKIRQGRLPATEKAIVIHN